MALTGAMYTGVSGLSVNQTWLNVIGNNIANSNTSGFKASRTEFKPQFYITQSEGSAPDTNFGGSNPSQQGLGTVLASIDKNFSPGAIQSSRSGHRYGDRWPGVFCCERGFTALYANRDVHVKCKSRARDGDRTICSGVWRGRQR